MEPYKIVILIAFVCFNLALWGSLLIYHLVTGKPVFSTGQMHPESHELAESRIHAFLEILRESPDLPDQEIVKCLVDKQIPSIDAQLITNFVPSAFARPALRKLGIAKIPNSYFVFNRDNSPVEFPLSNERYFVVALVISEAVFSHGDTSPVSIDLHRSIALRSWEMNAVNDALNAGVNIANSRLSPSMLLNPSAEEVIASRKPLRV